MMDTAAAQQHDRLVDYLNDKLQTFADFESLDSLLEKARTQQQRLRDQLQEAEQSLKEADAAYEQRRAEARRLADTYQQQQEDIDKRLLVVAQSDTSDEAVQRFDAVMEQLRSLDLADAYLSMLEQVDKLRDDASNNLQSNPDAALDAYASLTNLKTSRTLWQAQAEGAAPHLVDHIGKTASDVREILSSSLSDTLRSALKKFLWPKPGVVLPDQVRVEYERAFGMLLQMQIPELTMDKSVLDAAARQPAILLPFQVMVSPLEERFQFHFTGDKPTNRRDKPEYFLSHMIDLITTYTPFVVDYVQPVLLKRFGSTAELMSNPFYADATAAFITALLPMLRAKVFAFFPQVADNPPLLSHLMHEIMGFDSTLRDDWRYGITSTPSDKSWRGLAWEVLSHQDWFERWLQVEMEFALARYQSIVDEPDSGTLDYDSLESDATKPTKAAIRVNDLLETITERYRPLTSFSQKLRFLMDIQISIFDRFHNRLQSDLESHLAKTTSIGRTVQGLTAEESAKIHGVGGLDQLCRIFGSADYLERAMRDWSDDVFFLDLWNELQSRVKSRTSPGERSGCHDRPASVAGPLSLSEVASRTSSTLEKDDLDSVDAASGALFDETAAAYARLRAKAERVLLDTVNSALRKSLQPYARANPWSSLAPASPSIGDTETLATSIELSPVLDVLHANFSFLSKALGTVPLRRVGRQVAHSVDSYVFDYVLMGNSFSLHGARQISVDVDVLTSALDRHVGGQVGTRAMRRSLEACRMLALRVKGNSSTNTNAVADAQTSSEPSLFEVEKRLFAGNSAAREVLEQLGLQHLTAQEARELLRRRVELSS